MQGLLLKQIIIIQLRIHYHLVKFSINTDNYYCDTILKVSRSEFSDAAVLSGRALCRLCLSVLNESVPLLTVTKIGEFASRFGDFA